MNIKLISIKQASELLGVTHHYINQYLADGKLEALPRRRKQQIQILMSSVENFMGNLNTRVLPFEQPTPAPESNKKEHPIDPYAERPKWHFMKTEYPCKCCHPTCPERHESRNIDEDEWIAYTGQNPKGMRATHPNCNFAHETYERPPKEMFG